MYAAPTRCPVCRSELTVTRLHCPSCDTSIEGQFTGGPFAHLTAEHLGFHRDLRPLRRKDQSHGTGTRSFLPDDSKPSA